MNPRTKGKMDKINQRLEKYHQHTRVIELTAFTVLLNTGQTLQNNDANKFIKRVMNTKVEDWIKNTDALMAGTVKDIEIKSIGARVGGQAVQKKYGNKIKSNLNTGIPWNKGTKGQNLGTRSPRAESVKQAISRANSGENNGMYGYKMSDADKQLRSHKLKKKILTGEFTPKSNNRNTHWDSVLDGIKYRSSWEALYKYVNTNALYEELRIEYTHEGRSKIYIVDFVDHVKKILVEVKPKELCVGNKFNSKIKALTEWAEINSYTVLLVDQYWLKQQKIKIDYGRFDEKTALKIRRFYEDGKKN